MSDLPRPADIDVVAAPQADASAATSPAGGITVTALIVGILAALTGWILILGLVLGLVGVVLAILAIRARSHLGFGITGLVLSTLAVLTNVMLIVVIQLGVLPAILAWGQPDSQVQHGEGETHGEVETHGEATTEVESDAPTSRGDISGHSIATPCYRFDGPSSFINNQSSEATQNCLTTLQLWGQVSDGIVDNTGVGTIYGQVSVEPIRISQSESMAATGDLDAIVDALAAEYIPQLGKLTSLREAVTLDGQPANITRVKSDSALTKTKAMIVGFAPQSYNNSGGAVQLFVIVVVTPYESGDALINEIVSSWRWER